MDVFNEFLKGAEPLHIAVLSFIVVGGWNLIKFLVNLILKMFLTTKAKDELDQVKKLKALDAAIKELNVVVLEHKEENIAEIAKVKAQLGNVIMIVQKLEDLKSSIDVLNREVKHLYNEKLETREELKLVRQETREDVREIKKDIKKILANGKI